jgi:homoserine trans-succinylase
VSLERDLLLSFPYTDKILFETPISTGLRFESTDFFEVGLEWEHEVVHIFTDEYLEYEITSLFEEYLRDVEYGKVQFY